MTPDKPDAQLLLRELLVTGPNAQDIADACGVAQSLVMAWALGKDRPDPVSRVVMEEEYNIPRPAWGR